MAPFRYSAFGLKIESEFRFDVLDALERNDIPVDLRVLRAENVARADHPEDPFFEIWPDRQYLHWRAVGAFAVDETGTVMIEPYAGVSDHLVSQAFLGIVMSLLLERRGVLCLHAGAVVIEDRAAIFLGDKGAGKSTTCGALLSRGHTPLTDDLVAVDGPAEPGGPSLVRPGFPSVKLWPDALEALKLAADPRDREVHPLVSKVQKRLPNGVARKPAPIGAVFVLRRCEDVAAIWTQRLESHEALHNILRYTFITRFGETRLGRDHLAHHLRRCGAVVANVPVHLLHITPDLARLPEVADTVEAAMRGGSGQDTYRA